VLYLKNKKLRKNTKLIVVRIDSVGNLVNSTPCESCIRRIKQAGIKKVIYVNEAQKLIESRVENIKCIPSTKKSVLDWFKKVKFQ
jgi:deoxycytidylate deaminase